MPPPISPIQATAKLRIDGVDQHRGTAWLCTSTVAVTAAHCLKKYGGLPSERHESGLCLHFPGDVEVPAKLKWVDADLDAALLELPADDRVRSLVPLPCRPLSPSFARPGGQPGQRRWYAYGFPSVHSPGFYLTGEITEIVGDANQAKIELVCDQGAEPHLRGASGAAVCCEGYVIGLVREFVAPSVVFATPVQLLTAATGDPPPFVPVQARGAPVLPLQDVPPGPRPDEYQLTHRIIAAFAKNNDTPEKARQLITAAVRLRRAADPDDPEVTTLEMIDVPLAPFVARIFWTNAFHEAFNHGPRMVEALLDSQPSLQFDAATLADVLSLKRHLRSLWSEYTEFLRLREEW
jgi:hypothetical protein